MEVQKQTTHPTSTRNWLCSGCDSLNLFINAEPTPSDKIVPKILIIIKVFLYISVLFLTPWYFFPCMALKYFLLQVNVETFEVVVHARLDPGIMGVIGFTLTLGLVPNPLKKVHSHFKMFNHIPLRL